jgi:hypothetical protein
LKRQAQQNLGGVRVTAPDGSVHTFPTQAAADQFKKAAGMHKANDVRRSLQAIVDFAAEMNCAVIGITHFAKNTPGRNPSERVLGSQAFAAFARMVLVAAKEIKNL